MSLTVKFSRLPERKRNLLVAGVLLFSVLAAYSNSFGTGFHLDDFHQVLDNRNIRDLRNVPQFFTQAGLGSYTSGDKGYRPVTYASFALSYAVSGYEVWGYHALNVLLHFLNAFLLFLIAGRMLKEAGREDVFYPALAASLLFAVHPIQTGAVTYISGRAVLLAAFFYLLAFYAFISFRDEGGPRRYVLAASAPLLYLLGLLSKEMAVSLPAAMLAYDLLVTMPGKGRPALMERLAWVYAPLAASLAAYLLLKKTLQGFLTVPITVYGTAEYLISEAKALLLYIRLLLLPINQNADYGLPVARSVDALAIVALLTVAAAVYLLVRLRKGYPLTAFLGFWSLLALAPESTVVSIPDIAVEYRLYLPSAGFMTAAALLASAALRRIPSGRYLAAAVLVMLCVLTMNRNTVWADEHTLWSDVVRKSPGSSRAHANLGCELMFRGRYPEAAGELRRAVELDPLNDQSYKARHDLGICYSTMGMPGAAEEEHRKSIALAPGFVDAYMDLGDVLYGAGRYGEAADAFQKAARLAPESGAPRFNLAQTYTLMGRHKEALYHMEKSLRAMPDNFEVRYYLAVIYLNNGMPADAAVQAGAALALAGDETEMYEARALQERLGDLGVKDVN